MSEWTPPVEGAEASFKWGLNCETGEFTLWDVHGAGDGYPTHETYLTTAWGRRPRPGSDRLGRVTVSATAVQIAAYGGGGIPKEALAWAAVAFPGKDVAPDR